MTDPIREARRRGLIHPPVSPPPLQIGDAVTIVMALHQGDEGAERLVSIVGPVKEIGPHWVGVGEEKRIHYIPADRIRLVLPKGDRSVGFYGASFTTHHMMS